MPPAVVALLAALPPARVYDGPLEDVELVMEAIVQWDGAGGMCVLCLVVHVCNCAWLCMCVLSLVVHVYTDILMHAFTRVYAHVFGVYLHDLCMSCAVLKVLFGSCLSVPRKSVTTLNLLFLCVINAQWTWVSSDHWKEMVWKWVGTCSRHGGNVQGVLLGWLMADVE